MTEDKETVMGVPERDPNLHVVAQEGREGREIDRPQRYTRLAQLGNPPGYSDEFGRIADDGSSIAPATHEFPQPQSQHQHAQLSEASRPQEVPPAWVPEQPQQQQFVQQVPPQAYAQSVPQNQWQEPGRPQRRPGHSDWEVCLRFPFGRLRFGGFIGWESE